jgi:hypothetical protein
VAFREEIDPPTRTRKLCVGSLRTIAGRCDGDGVEKSVRCKECEVCKRKIKVS